MTRHFDSETIDRRSGCVAEEQRDWQRELSVVPRRRAGLLKIDKQTGRGGEKILVDEAQKFSSNDQSASKMSSLSLISTRVDNRRDVVALQVSNTCLSPFEPPCWDRYDYCRAIRNHGMISSSRVVFLRSCICWWDGVGVFGHLAEHSQPWIMMGDERRTSVICALFFRPSVAVILTTRDFFLTLGRVYLGNWEELKILSIREE